MNIKIYQKLIITSFLKILLFVSLIFFSLVFILNIFEEVNFFKDIDGNPLKPLLLTFLNTPYIIYEIFPFIILISTQFLFIKLIENNELYLMKSYGLNNSKILFILSIVSFFVGIFLILFFYNFSSKLKFLYFEIKNEFTKDNKYLAVITENGIWIKDEINTNINLINAQKIDGNYLLEVNITQLNKDFDFSRIIHAERVDISSNTWKLINATSKVNNFEYSFEKEINFKSNFDKDKINTLFDNLSSLTFLQLAELKNEYENLGYSTLELKLHNQKIISYPFFITIMTLFSGIIMLNIKFNRSKIFYLMIGILTSVSIYYVNYFSGILGENEKIPVSLSIWMPIFIFGLFSSIGMVKINEK
tara:strand:+ start:1157 stop:2239 length:1083 start_codon:yes stop_codon:yes gene_type:complete